jgi:hypothetical protein
MRAKRLIFGPSLGLLGALALGCGGSDRRAQEPDTSQEIEEAGEAVGTEIEQAGEAAAGEIEEEAEEIERDLEDDDDD